MKKKRPSLIYVYSLPAQTGLDYIRCRKLLNALEHEFEVTRTCAFVPDEIANEGALGALREQNQLVPESALLDRQVDVLFIEGRLELPFRSEETTKYGLHYKIGAHILKSFFSQGGITVFDLFSDQIVHNRSLKDEEIEAYQGYLQKASLPPLRLTHSPEEFVGFYGLTLSDEEAKNLIPHAIDEEHEVERGVFRVEITPDYLKWIHPSLWPVYKGVAHLLLSMPLPVELSLDGKVLIAGNPKTTRMLAEDMFWDGAFPSFGVLNDSGNGCSITITGAPFLDSVLEMGPSDAIRLLLNTLELLRNKQKERKIYLGLSSKSITDECKDKISDDNEEPKIKGAISPITILFLAADPTDASRLRLGEELREIQERLQLAKLREQFELHQRMSVRPADISQALLDTQPKIVHFSGHGTATGALCFETQIGETHPIQPDALAALFEQFTNQVTCVILNACYSEIQATAIAKHIDYVIGMNQAIGDKAAIAFAVGFYQALGAGRTIEEAYKLGCVQIGLQGIPKHLTPALFKKGKAKP